MGTSRIVVRRCRLFASLLLAVLGCGCARPAVADIVLSGNVIPSPAIGDPWNVGGSLSVGETADGGMMVSAGSDVNNTDGYVANMTGSSGAVSVSGTGSTWNSSGELRMGNFGAGTLDILAGGAVSVGGNGRLGNSPGGVGVATVDGTGSTLAAGNFLLVGREGNGTLLIQNGGGVSDLTGGIAIFEGSGGAVTIDGPGSAWNNTNELQVSDGGTGMLEIINGGVAMSPQGYLGVSADGSGTVTIEGANSVWNVSNQLQVGYGGHGTIDVESGGTLNSALGYVGVLAGGSGSVNINGAGATWANSSELHVGYDGNGALNVQAGGAVSSSAGFVGTNAGGDGTVTVDGMGATWTISGTLTVGSAGTGMLNIFRGGLVRTAALDGAGGVTLDGGILRITAGDTIGNTLTLNGGGGTFDVATAATTVTVTSIVGGTGGLSKAGAGTLELNGANTYNGDTRIATGRLNIGQAYLNPIADVYMAAGAAFGLNYAGTNVIDSLFLGGVAEPAGTYGAIGSGATFPLANFSGPGLLRVTRKGVLGDYNDNGIVDAADYTVWRNRLGSLTPLPNDDTPGVGFDDYTRWKANYGHTVGSGAGAAINVAVPEPAAAMLLVAGASCCAVAGVGLLWRDLRTADDNCSSALSNRN